MVSLLEGLTNGLRNAYCSNLASQPEWWGNLRRVLTPTDLRTRGDALNRWICGAGPDDDVPYPDPPFDGGQCPVAYLVDLVNANPDAGGGTTGQVFVEGPIQGVVQEPAATPGTINVLVVGANTVQFRVGNVGEQWSITAVTRLDSQPDDCGNPEPDLPPPTPIPVDVDITYGPSNEFNITVPVIFAPVYVALDGSLNVPVTIELFPDFELNGTLELFPDFELNVGFPTDAPPTDTGPDDEPPPDEPPPEPGDGTEEPEPEEPEDDGAIFAILLAGVIQPETRASGIFQEIGPDIYAPRLGSVRFGTTIEGQIFWSDDIDIKGLRSVIPCPFPWGATVVVVNPIEGVGFNWLPVSTDRPEWPPFLALGEQRTVDRRR